MTKEFVRDERGVSETIGYILLVSIVFFSVTSVLIFGVPSMNDKQHAVYMQNVEKAFETYADNLDDSVFNLAPARSTVLKLDEGTLFTNITTEMNITVVNETGETSSYDIYSTPVVYEKEDSVIAYEYGSVIMGREGGSSIVQDEPPFTFSRDMVSLPVIGTTIPRDEVGSSFDGKVTIVGRQQGVIVHHLDRDEDDAVDSTVYVNVSSPRYEAWGAYFESEGLTHVETDDATNTVSYKYETDDVYVKEVLIHVSSSR